MVEKYIVTKKEAISMLGNQEERTKGMKRQAEDLIDQAYQRGFKDGHELQEVITFDKECELIEKGRNEAWEAAKKIFLNKTDGGMSRDELMNRFGYYFPYRIITNYSASEAIAKLADHEEKKKQEENTDDIQVGDEVTYDGDDIGIVLDNKTSNVPVLFNEDNFFISTIYKGDLMPTGNHFPEVAKMLAQIKETD